MSFDSSLDRVTASDLFLLLWDDYGWSTDIGGLAILDGTSLLDPDGRARLTDFGSAKLDGQLGVTGSGARQARCYRAAKYCCWNSGGIFLQQVSRWFS